jgi:hypothetical protein
MRKASLATAGGGIIVARAMQYCGYNRSESDSIFCRARIAARFLRSSTAALQISDAPWQYWFLTQRGCWTIRIKEQYGVDRKLWRLSAPASMLQLLPVGSIPSATVRIAKAAMPEGNSYLRLRSLLGTVFDDEMFASLFPGKGQPAFAPLDVGPGHNHAIRGRLV